MALRGRPAAGGRTVAVFYAPAEWSQALCCRGAGRKTANLVVTVGFGKPGICVDTHVHRISNRLGFVRTKTPDQTELALRRKLPGRYSIDLSSGRHWTLAAPRAMIGGMHALRVLVLLILLSSLAPAWAGDAPGEGIVESEKSVVLNFDNADIEAVIRAMGEVAGFNYILAPDVRGKITVQINTPIAREEVLHVLLGILEVHGLTAIQSGVFFKIISRRSRAARRPDDCRRVPGPPTRGRRDHHPDRAGPVWFGRGAGRSAAPARLHAGERDSAP